MSALFPTAQQSHKATSSITSLVILDAGVTDLALLRSGVRADAAVHVVYAQRDGIAQITELLQAASYDQVHLVSHGAPGCLYLGNTELSLATLSDYALQLTTWDLAETDLLLYGCNLAAGDAGEEFLSKLHHLTGAKLYAADQPVGDSAQGGTWMLMPQQLSPTNVLETSSPKEIPLAFEDFILSRYTGLFGANQLDRSSGRKGLTP